MTFSSLGLSEPIVRAVSELGYAEPTPIQREAIPVVLAGRDLLAAAQTGTGKTAGFVLPILERLMAAPVRAQAPTAVQQGPARRPLSRIRALILTPTRELAAQVEENIRDYSRHLKLTSMAMFGGVSINPQIARLRQPLDILVATPGRLLDHVSQRTIDLSAVEILVLDEADRMLDMGFIHDIRRVIALLPRQRQNLLFSATFSEEIRGLANGLLDKPASVEVARRNAPAEAVAQKVILVDRDAKRTLLAKLITDHAWYQVLVFTRTKHGANRLAEQLEKSGISALAIHGNKSQNARTRALAGFKDGSLQVLVATDIAARGIDIDELPYVVNYELPNVPEDYVHRIGRTGRAGATGEALSLVCIDEYDFLRGIERLIGRELPRVTIPGFEPDPNARPEPIPMGGGARGRDAAGRSRGNGQAPRGGSGGQANRGGAPGHAPRSGSGAPQGRGGPAQPRSGGPGAPRSDGRPGGRPEGYSGGRSDAFSNGRSDGYGGARSNGHAGVRSDKTVAGSGRGAPRFK